MTDITYQDLCKALAWAEGSMARGGADAAARYILATVDAPEPTLADEIRGLPDFTMSGDNCINDCHERADDVAFRVEQMEHDLAEARAEVERLTAERDEITADRDRLAASNYILGAKAGAATVAREENVAPDQQGDPLPAPADVPEGQAWIVKVDRTDPTVGFSASGTGWVCYRPVHGTALPVGDERITLVSRLVPAPRQVTTLEDLYRLPEGTVVRDIDGEVGVKGTEGCWYVPSVAGPDTAGVFTLPATVLWTPEVPA